MIDKGFKSSTTVLEVVNETLEEYDETAKNQNVVYGWQ